MDTLDYQVATVCCLVGAGGSPPQGRFFAVDGDLPGEARRRDCYVLLPIQDDARARELLGAGFAGVLLGEAALKDSRTLAELAVEFGQERVGVLVPVRRMQVSWTMDTESNADFKVMRPSLCEPSWEVLTGAGVRTGTLARWWIGEMLKLGAGSALIQADIADDADLNIAAGLMEEFHGRLWFAPREQREPRLDDWIRYGQVNQIVLPQATFSAYLGSLEGRQAAGDRHAPLGQA